VVALLREVAADLKIAPLTQMQLRTAEKYHSVVKLEHLVLLSHNQQQTESGVKNTRGDHLQFIFSILFFLIPFCGIRYFLGLGGLAISYSCAVCQGDASPVFP